METGTTMDTILQQLNWRYATQHYDATRIISPENLDILKEAVRLAPTSYGLQPYKVVLVQAPGIRNELRKHSYNQSQITEASHLMVFAARIAVQHDEVDAYIRLIANTRNQTEESLSRYGMHIKQTLASLSEQDQLTWNEKQVYIALGQLLTTAALLHIDATPMEGFQREGYQQVLSLDGYIPVLAVALGYRSETDKHQYHAKVRKPMHELFEVADE